MLRILVPPAVAAASVTFAAVAWAGLPDLTTKPQPRAETAQKQVAKQKVLPPLKLPNVDRAVRQLASAERKVAVRQLVASRNVLRFWDNHRWLLAPRREKCAQVPWQRSCTVARASHRLHTRLASLAERRVRSEFPATNDWVTAVRIVQRAFPGTESWLLSCSGAEGGHGRFIVYGGGSYYPGAEHAQTFHGDMVGGNMQYMWGTFRGHYRNGLDSLRSRGFTVDLPDPTDVRAWLSPLAQAIAAGWARWSGNDNSHWSASWNNGCR